MSLILSNDLIDSSILFFMNDTYVSEYLCPDVDPKESNEESEAKEGWGTMITRMITAWIPF